MLSHSGDFFFIFLQVKINVAFFVGEGEDRMCLRPLQPGDFVLLVLKLELLDKICGKGRP